MRFVYAYLHGHDGIALKTIYFISSGAKYQKI